MSSDPLGLAAGVNTYGYVSGNSLGFSDRLGLFETNMLVKTIVGIGDVSTLGLSYYIRKSYNIGDDYYYKKNWTNPKNSEIDCFLENNIKNNTGFYRGIPYLIYNNSYAIAEHYDFSNKMTSYLGPIGAVIMFVEIPGYHFSKIATPFLHDSKTSPPSLIDLQYSSQGAIDGLGNFFSRKNNPYLK